MENQPTDLMSKVEGEKLKRKEKIADINRMINFLNTSDQYDDLGKDLDEFSEKLSKRVKKYASDGPTEVIIGDSYK
jgi:hypothetical protein